MSSESSCVRLRPHHLMCVHGFNGHGYSPEFVKNFWSIIDTLSSDATEVELVPATQDHICGPCPNNKGEVCADELKIRKLDDAYVETLKLKPGDRLSWGEAKRVVASRVSDEDFDRNCAPCGWRKLGVCKQALERLRKAHAPAKPGALVAALTAGLVALVSLVAQPARAQDTATEAPKFTTVEQLEQSVVLDKSKRVSAFYKIQTAINNHEWKKALDAAKPLEAMSDWSDYYHFLTGEAELGRMKKFMFQKSSATALSAAEQAKFHFTQVLGTNPYTMLWKRAGALLGEVELAMGEINLKNKHRAKAQGYFESGFQRLSQMNLLAMVPKATIVSYALICERNKTDLCTSWVGKLSPLVTKTDEARLIERIAAFRRVPIERNAPQTYKVDLDLQAFQKGFQSYLDGKFEDAYATWRDLLRDYPRTNIKLRTKFWMGRAAQRSQHDTQSQTLFKEIIKELPFSYYALLASWYGGIDLARMMDAELPAATAETPQLTPADIVHIRRAEQLIASAVPELAQLELQDVHAAVSMPNEFLVYLVMLNHLAGNHQAAFSMLSELSQRSFAGLFSSYGQKLYFPTGRLPLVRDLSKEGKVDPLLVLSVIKQESAFNEQAVSGANAYGLMQLIPPTARDLDHSIEVMDLFNPVVNVKLGTRYIKQLLGRFHGNVILALAAYNAGPHNADRWVREAAAGVVPEEFIELIGFKETREYVQSILRNYYWYARRIKGQNAQNLMTLTQSISPWSGKLGAPGSRHAMLRHTHAIR